MPKSRKRENIPSWLPRLVIAAAGFILIASAGMWWYAVYDTPQRAFSDMLSGNLKTAYVSRHTTQNGSDGSLDQTVQLNLYKNLQTRTVTTLNQNTNKSKVVTESIGTPTTDYVRYISFETSAKNAKGQAPDFTKVTNVWGKSDGSNKGQNTAQLFNEAFLGTVPFADLNSGQRTKLLKLINDRKVYQPNFITVKRSSQNFVYDVDVNPVPYIDMLQSLAKTLNLPAANNLTSASYQTTPTLHLRFTIDRYSHHLTKVDYKDSTNHIEVYSNYGRPNTIKLPTKTISITDLQTQLQSVQ